MNIMILRMNFKKILPLLLILLFLLMILPQSFAIEDSGTIVCDASDECIIAGNDLTDIGEIKVSDEDISTMDVSEKDISDLTDIEGSDNQIKEDSTNDKIINNEKLISEKSLKEDSYTYHSITDKSFVNYTRGESQRVYVSVDADLEKTISMEWDNFYVWLNGEGEENKIEFENTFADMCGWDFDINSMNDYFKDGTNTLTFHPSVDALERAGFDDYVFDQVTVFVHDPDFKVTQLAMDGIFGNGSIRVVLTDYYKKGIPNAEIRYCINDSEISVLKTDSNGKASFEYDVNDTAILSFYYDGNSSFNPSNYTKEYSKSNFVYPYDDSDTIGISISPYLPTISPNPNAVKTVTRPQTRIQCNDMVTVTVNQALDGRCGKYFEVNLTDSEGNPLANKEIKIGFNGVVYNRTTDASGEASLQINLAYKGTYTFAIGFIGGDDYLGAFEVSKIKVNPQKPKLSSSSKTYKSKDKVKTISASLKSKSGKGISGKTVKFILNGKTYLAKTNSKGLASVNVSLNKKGTYSFTAKFDGNGQYSKVSLSKKLVIK